jgi:hypothetical protein
MGEGVGLIKVKEKGEVHASFRCVVYGGGVYRGVRRRREIIVEGMPLQDHVSYYHVSHLGSR